MDQVVAKLKEIITKTDHVTDNCELDLPNDGGSSTIIDWDKIKQNININYNVIDELVNITFKMINKGKEKQHILDYINNQEIVLQDIYNWLLKNQNNSNSIYLLGYFNYHGIETHVDKQKTLKLYQK